MSEPVRAKSCGPCTLCCKVLAVGDLAKPMGVRCPHLARAGGCSIYADRPHACRSFECVWLMDPEMPHRFRPDQTKVVLDQDPEGRWLVARCDPANPQAWRRNPMHGALRGRAQDTWGTGKIVLAVAGRRTWLITPREDLDLGEIDPASDLRVTERPDGTVAVEIMTNPPPQGEGDHEGVEGASAPNLVDEAPSGASRDLPLRRRI